MKEMLFKQISIILKKDGTDLIIEQSVFKKSYTSFVVNWLYYLFILLKLSKAALARMMLL